MKIAERVQRLGILAAQIEHLLPEPDGTPLILEMVLREATHLGERFVGLLAFFVNFRREKADEFLRLGHLGGRNDEILRVRGRRA